jgi:Spy/CpxP family protein refolding chaperone
MNIRAVMAVVVAGLAIGSTAWAQPGEGRARGGRGGGEFWRDMARQMRADPLQARDLERAGELLGMTEDQRAAAETLVEGYEQRIRAMRDEERAQREEAMEAIRDGVGDRSSIAAMREQTGRQREKQAELETQLLADMKALLKPEQAEKRPAVESRLRRDQKLRRGLMSGERLNVREIVQEMKLEGDAAADVEAVLQQYDLEIDRPLAARDNLLDQPMPEFRGVQDPDAMEALRERMAQRRDASVKVRDVNKRFASQVEGVLPEALREPFKREVRQGTYPEIFRPTSGMQGIAKAMRMPDITPEQVEQLTSIEEGYKSKLATWQAKAVKAWDEMETQMTPERMGAGMRDVMRPLGDLRSERRELDRATLESLKKVLTEDQAKELPELERDEGGGGRRRTPRDL